MTIYTHASLVAQMVKKKNLSAIQETWVGKIPGEGHGNPLQDSWLENPHGQKSLGGYIPWDLTQLSDYAQHIQTHE